MKCILAMIFSKKNEKIKKSGKIVFVRRLVGFIENIILYMEVGLCVVCGVCTSECFLVLFFAFFVAKLFGVKTNRRNRFRMYVICMQCE